MSRVAIAMLIAFCLIAAGCNRARDLRNKECDAFSNWTNHAGDAMAKLAPEAEKEGARTDELQAAVYRKLAEGARAAAKAKNPFQDPYVSGLAARYLKDFDRLAIAFDHNADAWAKSDKAEEKKAQLEEMDIKNDQVAISNEWVKSCQQ